jgi:hypothetical protein
MIHISGLFSIPVVFYQFENPAKLQSHLIGHALKDKVKDAAWAIQKDNPKYTSKDLQTQRRLECVWLCLFSQLLFPNFELQSSPTGS